MNDALSEQEKAHNRHVRCQLKCQFWPNLIGPNKKNNRGGCYENQT